jgi:hypothetical protein
MQGHGTASTGPGARYLAASWTDLNGRFWLFGGFGHSGASSSGSAILQLFFFQLMNEEFTDL